MKEEIESQTTHKVELRAIEVNELHDIYSYSLSNLVDDPAVFIHGKNGMGKTTVLNMIFGLANGQFAIFDAVTFDSLIFDFGICGKDKDKSTGSFSWLERKLRIRKNVGTGKPEWDINSENNFVDMPEGYYTKGSAADQVLQLSSIFKYLNRASCGRHWTIRGKGHYDDGEVLENLNHEIEKLITTQRESFGFLSDWNVALVSSDRLTEGSSISKRKRDDIRENSGIFRAQHILAKVLKSHVLDSKQTDRKYEQEFLNSLFTDSSSASDFDEKLLRSRLEKINKTEEKMERYGLFPEWSSLGIPTRSLNSEEKRLLDSYLNTAENKLEPHSGFLVDLALFESLITSSLAKKEIRPHLETGLVVESSGNNLKLDQLSSGEQHLVIIATKLIFEVDSGSLVLIDEPELSMHLEWQRVFSSNLKKIGQEKKLKFICATHAPTIVGDNLEQLRPIKA